MLYQCYWLFALLAFSAWLYLKRRYSYWSDRGVLGPKPLPIIGNMYTRITADLYHLETEWMLKYGKAFGIYLGFEPVLFITDPKLIKQVLVRDFSCFINRANFPVYNQYLNHGLLFAQDEHWRRIRTITSPAFTSGKLRGMHVLMNACVHKLVAYLDELVSNDGHGIMDTKRVVYGFTIDVIASTSFATETNANDDLSKENPFLINARQLVDINPFRALAIFILPKFALKLLGIDTFFNPKAFEFFINLTKHIVEERKQQNTGNQLTKRHDLVQLMLDASASENDLENKNFDKLASTDDNIKDENSSNENKTTSKQKQLTDTEIIANLFLIFIAGSETTSSTISHTIFELAHNSDIQERLYNEVNRALELIAHDDNSEQYFEAVMAISYLEAVIKETLRKYPPIMLMSRMCDKDGVQLGDVVLDKNRLVGIPVNAVHHNAEYFPNPKRYDPNRFMPENKHLLVPCSFLAFAAGPRNCIGIRFAYQQVKLCLAKIIQRYRFELSEDTPYKLTFSKGNSLLTSSPFPINVHRR